MEDETLVGNVEKRQVGRYSDPEAAIRRLEESAGGYEALLIRQAERAAARLRSRKPTGQATTSDGAAIDPRARQA